MNIMRKILITGFKSFYGVPLNPAWEVVRRLPAVIGDFSVYTRIVDVSYEGAEKDVLSKADTVHPDIILCLGLAAKRSAITPEYAAINLRHSEIPDNHGHVIHDEPVIPGGPDAYFSTLPVRKMAEAMKETGVPAEVSYTAGTFVCNNLMYQLLHRYKGTDTKVGFIHVPLLAEQEDESAAIRTDEAVKAVIAAVEIL